jgi:hypothetical protein
LSPKAGKTPRETRDGELGGEKSLLCPERDGSMRNAVFSTERGYGGAGPNSHYPGKTRNPDTELLARLGTVEIEASLKIGGVSEVLNG